MCSQQEPRRGSVVVSISFLLNHNRPSPRLDAIQCSCHQAALNRFAIFACMVFRMMRHLRCQSLLLFHFHLFYTLNALAYHNVGICLWHVSLQTVMYQRISNKPKEPSLWFVVYVVCLKSDMPHHQRQVRSTDIAKRLFFMFLFQSPSIFLPNHQ